MAIFVKTKEPSELLYRIREGIRKQNIDTWLCDNAGDFTHDTDQWRYRAWMRPYVEADRLVFGIVCRKDRNLSVTEYAIYHGRFTEMLLRHFDTLCNGIEVTPLAQKKYDSVDKD